MQIKWHTLCIADVVYFAADEIGCVTLENAKCFLVNANWELKRLKRLNGLMSALTLYIFYLPTTALRYSHGTRNRRGKKGTDKGKGDHNIINSFGL
jgi:hypothetical protein